MKGQPRLRLRARRALSFLTSLTAGLSAVSALAAPPTKDECIDANRQAQTLRRSGKLHAARAALRVCASETCPGPVSDDCTSRLDEVERAMPSVVFEVRDGAGRDLPKVQISMDGAPFAQMLDGTPLAADPGEHTFVFESTAGEPVTEKLVLREGDRGRHERVVIASRAEAAVPLPPPPPREAPPPRQGQRIAGLVVGRAGIVSVGLGAVFGVVAGSSWSSSQSACASATSCSNHAQAVSEYNTASSDALVSTIGFVAGGALIAGGLVLFFTAPARGREGAASPIATLQFAPSVAPGEAGLNLRGTF